MQVKVLDQGHLRLEDCYPKNGDLAIVNNARQSLNVHKDVLSQADKGLIGFLMRERHGTPFEAVDFTFHVKAPIFVAREWFRHRIASYNELSGRYKELPTEFYDPALSAVRTQTGKPGAYEFKQTNNEIGLLSKTIIREVYTKSEEAYNELLKLGVAKELARVVLPVGLYTQFFFKTNLRSLFNFISLRADETALYEIRVYAQAMEAMVKNATPIAWEAFEKNGRVSP